MSGLKQRLFYRTSYYIVRYPTYRRQNSTQIFFSCLVKTSEVMSNFERTWAGTSLPSETATSKNNSAVVHAYIRSTEYGIIGQFAAMVWQVLFSFAAGKLHYRYWPTADRIELVKTENKHKITQKVNRSWCFSLLFILFPFFTVQHSEENVLFS